MAAKKKLYSFDDHPEHRAELGAWAEKWKRIIMSTDAMSDADREQARNAALRLYEAAKLPAPKHVVFVPSPFVARFAGGFAAWIWYLHHQAATDAATSAATYAATRDATLDATDAATYAATYDATYAATRAATAAATDAATRAATYAATYAATDDDLSRWFTGASGCVKAVSALAKEGGIRCAQLAYRLYQGGSAWAYVQAAIAFGRDHAKLAEHGAVSQAQYDKYAPWETLAKLSGFRFMHAKFCIVADRPLEYHIDDRHRPHCETGPFVRWADGSAFYSVHGVRVPAWVIEKRDTLTVAQIMAEDNAEVRRVMIGLYGRERFFSDAGAHVIEHLGEDYPVAGLRDARLLKLSVRGDDDWTMIDLRDMAVQPDGSKRRYMFRVNPAFYGGDAGRLVHAAAASIHRRPDDRSALYYRDWRDYAPAVET